MNFNLSDQLRHRAWESRSRRMLMLVGTMIVATIVAVLIVASSR